MDPAWAVEYRYSLSAKLRDVLYGVTFGAAPGMLGWIPFKDRVEGFGCFHVLASWAFFTMLAVVVLALVRWGRRARLDARGLDVQGVQLAWEEVEEIFPLRNGGADVRGAGRAVRLDWSLGEGDFRGGVAARCRERLQARMLERIRAGETVVLPGPWSRAAWLAAAAAFALFLSSPVIFLLRTAALPHDAAGCSVPPLLLVGGIAFFAWRAMLWRAARLEASAEGLRLCGLWRGPLRPWRRILRLDVTPDGGAFIVEEGGGDLPVPAVLANLDVLPGLHAALKR